MAIDVDTLQKLRTPMEVTPLDLSWLNLNDGHTYGMRAKPGKRGLTLDEIEIGPPGEVPEHSDNRSVLVRGSKPRKDVPRIPGSYVGRADVYSENTRLLYEEAVQRQWSSATDIPWDEIQPLPDDIERAMCQLCTFLTEVEFIAGDTPAQWMPRINSEHHEVKLFLLTQIMDEARHLDVFRKRAFANGGGLLSGTPQAGLRRIIDAETVQKVLGVLSDDISDMPKNWNRRFKHNREKIKTGDVFELAEVVRNLAIREWEKGLSTGEKQMYTRAKKILASEFMYALDKDEDGAEAYLDELLEESFGAAKATA